MISQGRYWRLGKLFQGRLHTATRKWVLGMLWNKHLAHSQLSQ